MKTSFISLCHFWICHLHIAHWLTVPYVTFCIFAISGNLCTCHHHRSITRSSSSRLHRHRHRLPRSFHSSHRTRRRPWSMCWSRSQRSNPRLSSPHRRPRSPASPRFTSFATRHRRRRPDLTPTALPRPRNMVRPPLHQHPRRPAARTVPPPTKHYISLEASPTPGGHPVAAQLYGFVFIFFFVSCKFYEEKKKKRFNEWQSLRTTRLSLDPLPAAHTTLPSPLNIVVSYVISYL